jgi:hypothetical protein
MKCGRCPYHVRQGIVGPSGEFVLSDVCGVKSAAGAQCTFAPFEGHSFKACDRYEAQSRGADRQILLPKNDMEYLPELGGNSSFSEMELM